MRRPRGAGGLCLASVTSGSLTTDLMEIWHAIHGSQRREQPESFGTPSVPELARRHADAHRWFESERCGRDVGPSAYRQWRQRYWRTFCRWRYIEHLLGLCQYREFEPGLFGVLRERQEWSLDSAMDFALQQVLRDDREQLDVLFHAPEELPRNRLLEVLALLNVNAARLAPPEWANL